ncbi:MAG: XdhC family protein [Microbacteriaceae bacterium]
MAATFQNLVARAQELSARREPFVRATVVRAAHPTSAHAGDTALILADGVIDGFVGGNCVQASVREYALEALSSQEPFLLRVSPGEPSQTRENGVVQVSNPCISGGFVEIFLEPQIPAPRVLIVGTTPIAQALAALGATLNLAVEFADGASALPQPGDAALIAASHGQDEEPALTAALRQGIPYVALVASRTRGAAVLASLDVDDEQRSRVHSPAGLDIGAHTPAEIALSILAELVAERAAARITALPAASASSTTATATAIDPVCGMTVAAVPASLHVEHDGALVYFCSPGCRTTFLADPERYAVAT